MFYMYRDSLFFQFLHLLQDLRQGRFAFNAAKDNE